MVLWLAGTVSLKPSLHTRGSVCCRSAHESYVLGFCSCHADLVTGVPAASLAQSIGGGGAAIALGASLNGWGKKAAWWVRGGERTPSGRS